MSVSRWSDLLIAIGVLVLAGTLVLPPTWQQSLPTTGAGAAPGAAGAPGRVPVRVVVAEVGLDAAVDPVGVAADGALALPQDVGRAGWWIGGAAAGDAQGSSVIAGHVDSRDGAAAMTALPRVREGMRVQVHTSGGSSIRYQIKGLRVFHKERLPAELFGTGGEHRLVLITCGGPFNQATRSYRDNVVVTATPV